MQQVKPTPRPLSKAEAVRRNRYEIAMGSASLYQTEFAMRQELLTNAIKQVCQQLLKGTITPLDVIMYASRLQQDDGDEGLALQAEDAVQKVFELLETKEIDADDLFENRLRLAGVKEEQAAALRIARTLTKRGFIVPGQEQE